MNSNLCDYNYVYILERGDITVTTAHTTQAAFKDCHPLQNIFQKLMEQQ